MAATVLVRTDLVATRRGSPCSRRSSPSVSGLAACGVVVDDDHVDGRRATGATGSTGSTGDGSSGGSTGARAGAQASRLGVRLTARLANCREVRDLRGRLHLHPDHGRSRRRSPSPSRRRSRCSRSARPLHPQRRHQVVLLRRRHLLREQQRVVEPARRRSTYLFDGQTFRDSVAAYAATAAALAAAGDHARRTRTAPTPGQPSKCVTVTLDQGRAQRRSPGASRATGS